MSNKQQTAVEWYAIEMANYLKDFYGDGIINIDILKQAKEMEWDQINNAYLQGFNDNDCNPHEDTFNLYYYNKTYGGGEQ